MLVLVLVVGLVTASKSKRKTANRVRSTHHYCVDGPLAIEGDFVGSGVDEDGFF